jgi:hypothetical protein
MLRGLEGPAFVTMRYLMEPTLCDYKLANEGFAAAGSGLDGEIFKRLGQTIGRAKLLIRRFHDFSNPIAF